MLEGSVVSPLGFSREAARRQLPGTQMIANAVATGALSGARLIAAIAALKVLVFLAVHVSLQ